MLTAALWPGWNWIMPAATPRMTSGDAPEPHPAPAQNTMGFHRLEKILRTSGRVAAPAARAADEMDHRRDEALIAANGETDETFHAGTTEGGRCRMRARPAARSQSWRNSMKLATAARQRAMVTIQ